MEACTEWQSNKFDVLRDHPKKKWYWPCEHSPNDHGVQKLGVLWEVAIFILQSVKPPFSVVHCTLKPNLYVFLSRPLLHFLRSLLSQSILLQVLLLLPSVTLTNQITFFVYRGVCDEVTHFHYINSHLIQHFSLKISCYYIFINTSLRFMW